MTMMRMHGLWTGNAYECTLMVHANRVTSTSDVKSGAGRFSAFANCHTHYRVDALVLVGVVYHPLYIFCTRSIRIGRFG